VTSDHIPQILAILPVSKDGKFKLVKEVRSYLGLQGTESIGFELSDEILLKRGSVSPHQTGIGSILLSEEVIETLRLNPETDLIALVQRPDAVAIKRVETRIIPGEWAKMRDIESSNQILRQLETNLMPEELLPVLHKRFQGTHLPYEVKPYFKGKKTLSSWMARQFLQVADREDHILQEELIEERLKIQLPDGSWGGNLFQTARNLRELSKLGLKPSEKCMQFGAEWLLNQTQSEANPGMFFGSEELVEAQAEVIRERSQTGSGRFREIREPEKREVINGDSLIKNPCGPRIMWPNALTVETLLRLGYEDHPRMQTALDVMASREWCECGYQLGLASWGNAEPMDEETVAEFEQTCLNQYRFGGLGDPAYLLREATLAKRTHVIRVSHKPLKDGDVYQLRMPDHIQGCEFITTRALSFVQRPLLRRFAEAHLWRFAGIQRPQDGSFPDERYGTGFDQAGILEAVSRYEHPAARVIVLRSIPWILSTQNPDGSWGDSKNKELTTLAVIKAFTSLGCWLPEAFIPSPS